MTTPDEPTTEPRTVLPYHLIRECIGQAIGEASMCWRPTPTGVFQSTEAAKLIDDVMVLIRRAMEQARKEGIEECVELYHGDWNPDDWDGDFAKYLHSTLLDNLVKLSSQEDEIKTPKLIDLKSL